MDIKINQIYKINEIYLNTKQTVNRPKDSKKAGNDSVVISEQGKDFISVMKTLQGISDIREDRVDLLKEKVDNGTYDVDSTEIAKKIYENFVSFKKALL